MENTWYGNGYTFDQVEQLRQMADEDNTLKADIRDATGGDLELTHRILHGPNGEMLELLRSTEPGSALEQDFDAIWGIGASVHYRENERMGMWDRVAELPRALTHGVVGAAAEIAEAMSSGQIKMDINPDTGEATAIDITETEYDANTVLEGYVDEPMTAGGQFVQGAAQFLAPFIATGPLSIAGKLSTIANAGAKGKAAVAVLDATVRGIPVDLLAFDEDDPLAIDMLAEAIGIEQDQLADILTNTNDDSDFEKRMSRVLEGAVLGVAADGLMLGIARVYRGIKTKNLKPDEASAQLAKLVEDLDVANQAPEVAGSAKRIAQIPMVQQSDLPWQLRHTPTPVDDAVRGVSGGLADRASDSVSVSGTKASGDFRMDYQIHEVETHTRLIETLRGLNPGNPPVKPSAIEHRQALVTAQKVWESVRHTDTSRAWEEAKLFLRDATDQLGGKIIRTKEELGRAVLEPLQRASRLAEVGDMDGLRAFAYSFTDTIEMRLNQAALRSVRDNLRQQTEQMSRVYGTLQADGKMGFLEETMMRDMFDQQVQFTLDVESLYQNIGSEIGAALAERRGVMSLTDEIAAAVKQAQDEAGKEASPLTVKRAQRLARMKIESEVLARFKANGTGPRTAETLGRRYRELVAEGVPPRLAFERVNEMGKEAARHNVHLQQAKRAIDTARQKQLLESETAIGKLLRRLEQWRYNAMLSGLKTHETNAVSSLAMMNFRIASEMFAGNKDVRLAAVRKAYAITTGVKEATMHALDAYKQMKPVLDQLSAFERLDPVYQYHILTYPTRLMLATDQFVKHLTYQSEVYAGALLDADLAGMDAVARKAFVADRVAKSIDPETGAGMDQLAISRAQEVTYQKQFDPDSKYFAEAKMAHATQALSSGYLGRLMFPFMRIFFRLMNEGIRLTPGVRDVLALAGEVTPAGSKFGDDLMGRNGAIASARARGEYAVGVALTGWTLSMVAEGNITGGEETHYVDAMMRRQQIPPYSIKIGDKWYSYERFEPFATPVKFMANMSIRLRRIEEGEERGDYGIDEEAGFGEYMAAVAYSMGQMVTNNSFMEGMESIVKMSSGAFQGQEGAADQAVGSLASSYVPNILQKINNAVDDTGYKYTASPLSYEWFKRFGSSVLDMEDVDLRRNQFLGDPEIHMYDVPDWTSFAGKPVKVDPAMDLMIEANEQTGKQLKLKTSGSFSVPVDGASPVALPDLKTEKSEDGKRSLYDKYLEHVSTVEIGGLTYREALVQLSENPAWQALPWGNAIVDGTRIKMMSDLKNDYEKEAKALLEQDRSYEQLVSEAIHESQVFLKGEAEAAQEYFRGSKATVGKPAVKLDDPAEAARAFFRQ